VGTLVDGSALLATVPASVAREIVALRPHLRVKALPFALAGFATGMLWRSALDDDEAIRFVQGLIVEIAADVDRGSRADAR
jgi:LysR family transcriptional activator of mexEF-oprN operon